MFTRVVEWAPSAKEEAIQPVVMPYFIARHFGRSFARNAASPCHVSNFSRRQRT